MLLQPRGGEEKKNLGQCVGKTNILDIILSCPNLVVHPLPCTLCVGSLGLPVQSLDSGRHPEGQDGAVPLSIP